MDTQLTYISYILVCLLGLTMAFSLRTQASFSVENEVVSDMSPFVSELPVYLDTETVVVPDVQSNVINQDTAVFLPINSQESTTSTISTETSRHQYVEVPNAQVIPASSMRYDIPFFSQAPNGNRWHPRGEACEETSVLLAYYGILWKPLTKKIFMQEVLAMTAREKTAFAGAPSITLAQTQQLFTNYLHYTQTDLLSIASSNDIKKELADGNLVVAWFAGRLLDNPYFVTPGPVYHMMVIIGYEDNNFIVHDVGTRRGASYRYEEDVLFTALHDYVPGDITKGLKRILVVKKEM